jgi:hypothetical protein
MGAPIAEVTVIQRAVLIIRRPIVAGAVAGAIATFVFTIIHDLTISDIWFSFPSMLVAGVLSGTAVAWTYSRLFDESPARTRQSIRTWITFNLIYDTMFVLLGIVSVLLLEPVTTMAAVLAANDFPAELIRRALPMTVVFGLGVVVILSWRYARQPLDFVSITVTTALLIAVLGLNVSPIGLVEVPTSGFVLIAQMFGLIFALNAVYAASYVLLVSWDEN